jgi:hypothetical protein
MTFLPLLHMLGTSQTWWASWFAFLVIFVSNFSSSLSLPFQLLSVTFINALHCLEHRTSALDRLVSFLSIFHVLCCLSPCISANQFFAHYSISYDSNRVPIHSINAACAPVPLVSSYIKFCASYSNPPSFGRIFVLLVRYIYWHSYHPVRSSLKDLDYDFAKTEDDIKAVQSVGQIIGEVMKQLDDKRCQCHYLLLLQCSTVNSHCKGF